MVDLAALVDRAPEPARRFAYRVAAGEGRLGRIVDAVRFRFSEDDVPRLPPRMPAAVRLLIGPANSAGQGYLWARAVERYLPDASVVAMYGIGADPFQTAIDLRVPRSVYQRSGSWHRSFEAFLAAQTHVLWESGLPLLGRSYGSDLQRELARLEQSGVRGGLMFHGSDIRPPARHAAEEPWSPFRGRSGPVRSLEESVARNLRLAESLGVPVFVSTPDLVRWIPDASWCPVVVDIEIWRAAGHAGRSGPPVVAHAPSQPWLKGTDRIERMLARLAEEGVIEYRQLVGVPHASMPAFYAEADIVLDQFALGSYGVAACEALAAGKLVIGHVDDHARAEVRARTGLELPIHEATIDSLEAELRKVATDLERFADVRAAGPRFVREVHDGRRSAAALAPFLGLSA